MTTPLFTLAELDAAAEEVGRAMAPTPQQRWPLLDEAVGTAVWVKHENHTPVGSFKVRGGLVHLQRLARSRPRPRGVVAATRGNHGQSLAFAAVRVGMDAVIAVPEGNNPDKNAAMRALGARVVVAGRDFDEARVAAREIAAREGLATVPAFHPDLVLGVATYARELLTAVADLDVVYVPVGMGSGLVTVRDLLGLATRVVGVVSAGAPAFARSFAARRRVTTPSATTIADGVACREPDPDALAVVLAGAADVVTVTDDEVTAAMRLLLATTHNLPEPTGALPLAAVLADRERLRGRRVGVVLTGGNVDAATLSSVLAGAA